jgi:hypothetical protein
LVWIHDWDSRSLSLGMPRFPARLIHPGNHSSRRWPGGRRWCCCHPDTGSLVRDRRTRPTRVELLSVSRPLRRDFDVKWKTKRSKHR